LRTFRFQCFDGKKRWPTRARSWWVPDARWHENAGCTAFILLTLGPIGLGAYQGFEHHEAFVGAIAAVEAALCLGIFSALGWEFATSKERIRDRFARQLSG